MQYRYIKTYSLSRRGENKLIVSSILFPFSFLFFTGRKTEPLHNYFQTTSIVGRIITSNVIIISNLIKTRESFRSSWNHSAVSAHISPSKKEERRSGEGEGKKRRKKKILPEEDKLGTSFWWINKIVCTAEDTLGHRVSVLSDIKSSAI